MDEAYKKIKLALEKTQSKQKKAADHHRRELVFSLGDWVLLRFEKARLRKMKGKERLFPKLGMRYYGPFQVCDKISDVAYRLKLSEGWKIHNAFHVSLLRHFVGDVPEDMVPEEQPEVEELDEILVPEQILAHKDRKVRGKVARCYLVKMKNYSPMDAKWMEEAELMNFGAVMLPKFSHTGVILLDTDVTSLLASLSASNPSASKGKSKEEAPSVEEPAVIDERLFNFEASSGTGDKFHLEVHGQDGQSSELQQSLDYSGMHRVIDEEDFDDTVEDLDGAEDYLSDRREEEEVEESDIFPRLVAVAVIQHAIVTRRRLVFDPLGSTRARSRVQPVEFSRMALVEFSHEIGIQNSGNGLTVGVRTAESKMQTEERWRNGMGEKCLGILKSEDNHFQDIIAPSSDVINERTRNDANFAWRA
ncbi:hypothetical protein L7F22_047314 [Adiantum nelumboides]|nr:hypothetical protein [Adiantum nelumboides]